MARWGVLGIVVILAGCTGLGSDGVEAPEPEGADAADWPAGTHALTLVVDGTNATGIVGVPSETPRHLVVLCHPFGTAATFFQAEMEELVESGVLALAMDYRGAVGEFNVMAGAQDTVAATLQVQEAFPGLNGTLLYGWSMGGEVSGIALDLAPPGTYDVWIDGAGVADLAATWAELPLVQAAIEAETGGTPVDVPSAYDARSPLHLVDGIAGHGLSQAYLLYGAADGIVPPEHGLRLHQALADAGVRSMHYTVTQNTDVWPCLVCPRVPLGPAGHEAGEPRLAMPLIKAHVEGQAPALAGMGLYDGVTGERTNIA